MADHFAQYFAMGGYAAFVWPAFALSFGVLVVLLVSSLKGLRESEKALDTVLGAAEASRAHDDTHA
jgi:heme exporter protein D